MKLAQLALTTLSICTTMLHSMQSPTEKQADKTITIIERPAAGPLVLDLDHFGNMRQARKQQFPKAHRTPPVQIIPSRTTTESSVSATDTEPATATRVPKFVQSSTQTDPFPELSRSSSPASACSDDSFATARATITTADATTQTESIHTRPIQSIARLIADLTGDEQGILNTMPSEDILTLQASLLVPLSLLLNKIKKPATQLPSLQERLAESEH